MWRIGLRERQLADPRVFARARPELIGETDRPELVRECERLERAALLREHHRMSGTRVAAPAVVVEARGDAAADRVAHGALAIVGQEMREAQTLQRIGRVVEVRDIERAQRTERLRMRRTLVAPDRQKPARAGLVPLHRLQLLRLLRIGEERLQQLPLQPAQIAEQRYRRRTAL